MEQYINTAKEAAAIGGKILMDALGSLQSEQVSLKGTNDYVTELDHKSEEAIIEHIKSVFPDHSICAEETGFDGHSSEFQWIIDPLDGTTNYVHGIPFFSVTVALVHHKEILAGVVLDPIRKEEFWAVKGEGAYLNDQQIHVGQKDSLHSTLLGTGFPWRSKQYWDAFIVSFNVFFENAAGVRRMGSAAIDLSYTACGRFDGFWEMKLKPWDIAAGILILKEAGGIVTDFIGGSDYMESGNVVAANPKVHAKMVEITKQYLAGVE